MMFRKLTCLLAVIPLLAVAQNKMLTVEDAVMKGRTSLAPERMPQLQFIPGTHSFSWIGKSGGKEVVMVENADNLKVDTLIGIAEFKNILNSTGADVELPEKFPAITWSNANEFRFFHANVYFQFLVASKSMLILNRIPKEAEDAEIDTFSKRISFTMAGNVWAFKPETYKDYMVPSSAANPDGSVKPKEFLITTDATNGLQNGKAVHRNEFGITKGIFWSPSGKRFAFYKLYEGMVTDYPIIDLNTKPANARTVKYPMAGALSHIARIFVHDFSKKLTYPIITGQPEEQYLTNISWSPNEEDMYVVVVNREQNKCLLNKYDATTGAYIKTLIEEVSPKYVEPEHPVVFVKGSNRFFIWQSKRDGHNQLYLYEQNGKFVRQLTKGDFEVTDFLGFNSNGSKAYYMVTANNSLERQCYSVEIETGKVAAITRNAGVHSVAYSDDGKYFLDSYSSQTTPRKILLTTDEGLEKAVVLQAQNPIFDYKTCGIRLGQITSADKVTKLNYRMIFPPNFDSTRKYPVLVYLYGGPHAQMVYNTWLGGADLWLYYMAQQGFIIYTMDNRGSANRGVEFEQATFRNLGKAERDDQLEGVAFLKKQKYVDGNRLGVYGWSFGGFMSTGLMTRSDAFKVGVAGGPVIDWRLYEIMYTERYMDTPGENPDGYKDADLTNYVKNLKGKLLMIHGLDDETVVLQHSLAYVKKCVDENVQIDYFVYPGHKHNVLGKDRVHLMQKITDYFKSNL